MRIKGRLKELYEFIGPSDAPIYDLFCDHGILGARYLKDGNCEVFFNDKREHLVNKLRLSFSEEKRAKFDICDAKDMRFIRNSKVIMAGVGGLTMISCFSEWLKTHEKDTMASIEFFVSPHYYGFDLRHFLYLNGFSYCCEALVEEGRYIYELAKVTLSENSVNTPFFNKAKWSSFGERGKLYLSFTHKNLTNKSVLKNWERELLENIQEVI